MRVLILGPFPPPFHGQSIALSIIESCIADKEKLVVSTTWSRFKLMNILYSNGLVLFFFLFSRFDYIYFTSTRNKTGFLTKDLLLLLLARWHKKRVINHLHGANFKSFYRNAGFIHPLVKYCFDNVQTSIVLMEQMIDEFSDFPEMKIHVVRNCYVREFDDFNGPVMKTGNRIVFMSNLMKSKGIMEFLDAAEQLLRIHSGVIIDIAGLPYQDDYAGRKEMARDFDRNFKRLKSLYPGRIYYHGLKKGYEKLKFLFNSDIFVMPSWHPSEAFPLTIIEAMRAGNAIITTNHNFLPSIVKPENGIIVEPQCAEELTKAVITLVSDQDRLKMIQAYNRSYAREHYNQDLYVKSVSGIIFKNSSVI